MSEHRCGTCLHFRPKMDMIWGDGICKAILIDKSIDLPVVFDSGPECLYWRPRLEVVPPPEVTP